ncbi:MAG TPA: glucose 1-dehydrogenase [Dehalococcoidia bacterium]|jgi:NAD(P)-dependent dehydrogenase (short-subunit alcohol dehydrogenase family)
MDFSKISLKGKVALVSGASRGIGEASALAFADAGAHVVLSSRKQSELDKVAEKIRAKGVKSLAIAAHIAHIEDSRNLVKTVVKEFGKIDILFNNAGTNPYVGPLLNAEEWAWDTTFNVNLKGPFFLAKEVAMVMKEHGGGAMINTASVGALRASDLNIYSVTKAAYVMLTQVMAKEWGQWGIRVNAIAPGLIKTRLSEALWKDPAMSKSAVERIALLRLGEPDDVAGVVLFLASDLAKYVTGETVVVDGGQLVGAPSFRGASTDLEGLGLG